MELKSWIPERFTPVVMVVTTPEAEEMVQLNNGLTVVEMLRPHGVFHNLSVPVRTVGEQSYRIRELKLRLHYASSLFQPTPEAAEEYLQGVVKAATQGCESEPAPDIAACLRKGEPPGATPWFDTYQREFMRMLAFGELETFDHPVACLLVAHAGAEDPVQTFQALWAGAALPPLMRAGVMELRLLLHHLLLHDDSRHAEGGYQRAEEKLRVARAALGHAAVGLARVNSGSGDPASQVGYAADPGRWAAALAGAPRDGGAGELAARPAPPPGGLGARLTGANQEALAACLQDLAVRSLLPALEGRVRALNHQVTSTRRGLRNQLKTLLWRKASPAPGAQSGGRESPRPSSSGGSGSGAASVEGQMRALADLAFLMQDYETAASTLRLLAGDLRADKAWRQYAAAQEMLGLALVMLGAPPADAAAAFKEAFLRYSSAAAGPGRPGKDCVRLATRAALLTAAHARSHGNYGEANFALMKAHFPEEGLRAALLLEQAALCLLRVAPPALRKFAFHMVLAGLRYSSCGQSALGARAYRQVLGLYAGRQWAFIEEHLHSVLGARRKEAGDAAGALEHFAAMLVCPQSPRAWQATYLRQFLDTVAAAAAAQGESPVLDLPLPEVDAANVTVVCDDQVCHADGAARALPDEAWRRLEAPLLPGVEAGLPSWLDGGSSRSLAALPAACCVAGEALTVGVILTNPLALDLALSAVRLLYEHDCGEPDDAEAEEQTLSLAPGQRTTLQLVLRVRRAGALTLRGLEWTLNGHARGRRLFEPRRARGRRGRGLAKAPASGSLSFTVLAPAPCLQVALEALPGALLVGELAHARLVLTNAGPAPLRALRCTAAGPDLHLTPDVDGAAGRSATEVGAGLKGAGLGLGLLFSGGRAVYAWPPALELAPGARLEWPLWVHPRAAGALDVSLAFCYEPAQAAQEGMKYRLLRLRRVVDVAPALALTATLTPSVADLNQLLLRLDAEDLQGAGGLRMRQLSCTRPGWGVCSLQAAGSAPPAQETLKPGNSALQPAAPARASEALDAALGAGERAALFFRLHPPDAAAPRINGDAGAGGDAGGPPRLGLHHMYNVLPRGTEAVRAVAQSPARVLHDFGAHGACVAVLRLGLRSCLPERVTVTVSTGAGAETAAWRIREGGDAAAGAGAAPAPAASLDQAAGLRSGAEYVWVAATHTLLPDLAPGAAADVALQVAVFAPGMYEVGDYSIAWTRAGSGVAGGSCPGPSFLFSVEAV
ncbi:hypothetical protein WJX81_000447 [Elliptochloris bilobata]|uniref:Trafficking protein particle complex subunit 11 domain-containing protein n=1 Tax=Elliptochloris bilobata TaxID=381761 RepID=A0AAW1QVB1_9CHLO